VGIPGISGNAEAIAGIFEFFYKPSILGNYRATKSQL
jgi:hypothetical protein